MENKTSVIPEIRFLSQILDKISTGELRVPKFQRKFVWKPADMVALFESIENGYPIGSLLFWESEPTFQSFDSIGPFKIPINNSNSANFILDGHQRLSTLYGILIKQAIANHESNYWIWSLYYDLKNNQFVHDRKGTKEPHYAAINSLLNTLDFLRESKRILESCGENATKYVEKFEKLSRIFREYQIPITQIKGGNLDSAVNIFSRLNSKGVSISEDQMYSALTYKEGGDNFNLSDRIDLIQEKLIEYHFAGIKRAIIFRAILAASGKNIYTEGNLTLFKDNSINLRETIDNCEQSLIKAIEFLRNEIGVPQHTFLPYNIQLIALSEFFRLCPNPNPKISKLKQWFWVTSFAGIDTVNSSKNRNLLDEIRDFAMSEGEFTFKIIDFTEEAQPFPNAFNLTSARVKAYVLFLLSLNPESINDQQFNAFNSLAINGYKAFHYLSKGSSVANRILLGPIKSGYAKKWFTNNSSSLNESFLRSHGIPKDCIKSGNFNLDSFIQQRETELIKLEREFMLANGVVPSRISVATETLSDSDLEEDNSFLES